jgi:hypothetical protein
MTQQAVDVHLLILHAHLWGATKAPHDWSLVAMPMHPADE